MKRGETLSGISRRYYGSARHYGAIRNEDGDPIADPNRLRIGQILVVPPVAGGCNDDLGCLNALDRLRNYSRPPVVPHFFRESFWPPKDYTAPLGGYMVPISRYPAPS